MPSRVGILVLAMMILLGAARAEALLCVVADGQAMLTDATGEVILAGDGIEDAFTVREGALYAAGRRGSYRLFDAHGEALGETVFSMVDDAGDCLIYRAANLYGAMDARGEVLLKAEWTQLVSDGADGWLALDGDPLDENPDEIVRVDAHGEATPTGVSTLSGLNRPCDGRMPFLAANGRYGALDAEGHIAVEALWAAMGEYQGGLAKVAGDRGMGMIDADGAVVIEPDCAWLERGEGFIAALREGGVEVYAPDGSSVAFRVTGKNLEADVAGQYLVVTDADGVRVYGATGRLVGAYDTGTTFAPGADGQLIASDGAWVEACAWLVNPDGSTASGHFQALLPLCAGRYAWLSLPGSEYYSPSLERLQTSWNYEAARWGLLDAAGRELLPADYLEIRPLGDDRLLLVSADAVTLANADGVAIRTWITSGSEAATAEAAS